MNRIIIFLLTIALSESAISDNNIKIDPEYISTIRMIESIGKDRTIKNMVLLQQQQTEKFGNRIDEYSDAIRVYGNSDGITQVGQINVDKLFNDLMKRKKIREIIPDEKYEFIQYMRNVFMSKGGMMYEMQANALCSYPPTRAVIDSDIEYHFVYHDNAGVYIGEMKVDELSCIRSTK